MKAIVNQIFQSLSLKENSSYFQCVSDRLEFLWWAVVRPVGCRVRLLEAVGWPACFWCLP